MSVPSLPETGDGATCDGRVPFWFRAALRFRSPWAAALCCFGAYFAVAVPFYNLTGYYRGFHRGETLFFLSAWGSVDVSYALFFAWVPVAIHYLVRGAAGDLENAGPVLSLSGADLASARFELLDVGARTLWLGAAFGMGFALLSVAVIDPPPDVVVTPPLGWILARELLVDALIFSVGTWGLAVAHRFSALARERARFRLLDPSVFAPFASNGLRLSLLWIAMWSLQIPWTILASSAVAGSNDLFETLLAFYAFGVLLTAVAVVLPTRGPRDAIRAAKRRELVRVRAEIEQAREGALGASASAQDAGRLPGLLAWERRVQEVNEWPLDAPVLRRLGMYLLIPLMSWIGGALVERVVDLTLG